MARNLVQFQITLSTPFGAKAVRASRKTISLFVVEFGFSDQARREIELCFSEALQNAMEHGSGTSCDVHVECTMTRDKIKLVVEDPGAGEGNPEILENAFNNDGECPPHIDNERGRGIFLIRSMMDDSKMERMDQGGIRIIMSKNKS